MNKHEISKIFQTCVYSFPFEEGGTNTLRLSTKSNCQANKYNAFNEKYERNDIKNKNKTIDQNEPKDIFKTSSKAENYEKNNIMENNNFAEKNLETNVENYPQFKYLN